MNRRCKIIWLLLLAPLAMLAQDLSLEEAVRQALASHPSLGAAAQREKAAEGLRTQAGLRLNPRAVLQTENWRSWSSPGFNANQAADHYGYLLQPIETAGKRQRRTELASAELRRSELERELRAKQIAGRVAQAYWAAAGAQKLRDTWVENRKNFEKIIIYHEIRVREGAMPEADLLKVRLEGERMAVSENSAALEAERTRIQLFREMGMAEFPPLRLSSALALDGDPLSPDLRRALEERTEIKLARNHVEQMQANERLQQAAAKPDLDVILGYKRTGGFHTVMGGVQVPLPFFNRNQGNIAAAAAEIRAGESELAATEALVRAEVLAAQNEVAMRRRQLTEFLQDALRRAGESSRIALAAYQEGGADLLGLLDAERVRIDLELLYYRTLSEYRQSVANLQTALGVMP